MDFDSIFSREINLEKHEISIEGLTKAKIMSYLAKLERKFEILKEYKDDSKINQSQFFEKYTELYNLKLLSEEALAKYILKEDNVSKIRINQEEVLEKQGYEDHMRYYEYFKMSYNGYIGGNILGLEELSLSHKKIAELIKNNKLVLSFDTCETEVKLDSKENKLDYYNANGEINKLPYFGRNALMDVYSFNTLSEGYPDITSLIRNSLSCTMIDNDCANMKKALLINLNSRLDENIEEKTNAIRILSRHKKVVDGIKL